MNDCWPCTSWSIVDYFLRPKPAYFAIARELRQLTVGITRSDIKIFSDDSTTASYTIVSHLEIWGTNSTLSDQHVTLEVSSFDLHSNYRDCWSIKVVLASNSSTELYKGRVSGQKERSNESEVPNVVIVSARLLDDTSQVLARHSNWYARIA